MIRKTAWLLGMTVLAIVVYYRGLSGAYYGDDLGFAFDDPLSKIGYFFTHPNPFGFYRPLEGAFLATVQAACGLNTLPIHLVQICLHALLCWMVVLIMLQLGLSTIQAGLAMCFLLVCQANVLVVLSNDTFSQSAGTFFGCVALYMLLLSLIELKSGVLRARQLPRRREYVVSLAAFALALLSKETSVSFILLITGLVFIWFGTGDRKAGTTGLVRVLVELAPYFAVLLLYLLVRSIVVHTQPALGEGRNEFRLGTNIVINLAMCVAAMSSPFSTVSVMAELRSGEFTLLAGYAFAAMAFVALVFAGLTVDKRRRMVLLLAGCSVIALVPMIALNHVSEAHIYNSMPFFSILVGMGLGTLGYRAVQRKWRGLAYATLVLALYLSHYQATQYKVGMMRANGARATELLQQIEPFLEQVPANGELVLANPPGESFEYSIFALKDFNVLALGLRRSVERMSGRRDITVRIADGPTGLEGNSGRVVLTLTDGNVHAYR